MRLVLILIIIYLIMQNPDMKKKVDDFIQNFMHNVKQTTEDVKNQATDSIKNNDLTKELSSVKKNIDSIKK
jgi:hypothetical protein